MARVVVRLFGDGPREIIVDGNTVEDALESSGYDYSNSDICLNARRTALSTPLRDDDVVQIIPRKEGG